MNSGRFTTIFEVAIALDSLERQLSWRLLFLFFFFFFSLGFPGSSGSCSSEGEADDRDGGSSSEGSPPNKLEPWP